MPTNINPRYPVVVVCNISETFYPFLNRASQGDQRKRLILAEQYRGDRALMWLGRSKLVFTSHLIPHAEEFRGQFGYLNTKFVVPDKPSAWLCQDLMNEPALLEILVDYAGPSRTVQLIPYATTKKFYQLVETLKREYGLIVLTPESPNPDSLWIRDYIDTKLGFHVLVSQWLHDSDAVLPKRIVCQDLEATAAAVHWFGECGLDCLIKADDGENGIGNFFISPDMFPTMKKILEHLGKMTFLGQREIVVEEFIHSTEQISPSLEVFVPPIGQGWPEITYLSRQIFQGPGDFCGVMVDRSLLTSRWYSTLAAKGMEIAHHLQEMGYVGHFDLDAIVNDENRPYLLEINSRRTGGTHVHEFGLNYFGPHYLDDFVLMSNDAIPCEGIEDYPDLRAVLEDYLYPRYEDGYGLIITVTSSLVDGEFGAIFVAPNTNDVLRLQNNVTNTLKRRLEV